MARCWALNAAAQMPSYLWWDQYGSDFPELQQFARMVLAQPASASIIERINSEFAFVKDVKRNRLMHERAEKLVALFHNLRLMSKMKSSAYVEPTIGWNDDVLKVGVEAYGVHKY
ncbi:hypothetical protein AB1Y20_002830 [Prymnesium parvum]|uniref:HAT C-terminal dimerisation domain-containing protein n=1 Tax=Prymnesium parvum TaxID=97485 RepID=A0AB34JA92_PRYPA